MQNTRLDEAQAGIKIDKRNANNLRYADGPNLSTETEDKLKSFLMKVKEDSDSEKSGLNSAFRKLRSWHLVPSVQFSSVAQSCPTLCDPMDYSTSGLPVHCQLLKITQTHVH